MASAKRVTNDNVKATWIELLKDQVFHPRKNQLLLAWFDDEQQYNNGADIEVKNHKIHGNNN